QYEDFFNVTGMGTPEDLEEFRSCQNAYQSTELNYNDMSRGANHWIYGQEEQAKAMNIHRIISGIKSEDKGLFITQHEYWKDSLKEGIAKEVSNEVTV